MFCELHRKRSFLDESCLDMKEVCLKRFKRPVRVAGMIIEEEENFDKEEELLEAYHTMIDEINKKELTHLIREYNLAKAYFPRSISHN